MTFSNISIKIAANTVYQLIGKAATMSITIAATMLITRIYGRNYFGEFSIMQGWPALFFIIVDFGINTIASRELSRDFSKAGRYFFNILMIRILISIFFIIFLSLLINFFPYNDNLKFGVRLSLLLILTQSFFSTANIIFQTKLRYDYSVFSLLSGYVVILIIVLLSSYLKLNIIWVSFSYVVGGFITFTASLYFVKKLCPHIDYVIDKVLIKSILFQSLPLGVMFIFSQMNFKEDEILLSFMHLPQKYNLNNAETVGLYSLPYKVFEVALVVPTFLMNSVFPVLVKQYDENAKKFQQNFKKLIMLLALFAIIAGMVGYGLSPLAINILGGSEFGYSITILRILLFGLIFYSLTQPLSYFIVIMNKQKVLPIIYLIAAVVNVMLNVVFIPKYSFYAAAINTHICEMIILTMLIFFSVKFWKKKDA